VVKLVIVAPRIDQRTCRLQQLRGAEGTVLVNILVGREEASQRQDAKEHRQEGLGQTQRAAWTIHGLNGLHE